jgi:UDP-glucose 4-epimerase
MKILITGGAGFIGSHISKLLLDQGAQVVIYDNLSRGYKDSIDKRASLIKGDLNDPKAMVKALKGIDSVIHMASLALVEESTKQPLLYGQNNIIGSINLLEAMREAGVKRIVFSSSACVYGTPKSLPITEDLPQSSANPYGASKIAVEQFLQAYSYLYGFDVTILRYFNPYGPQERHLPETHAIPNFIKAALKKEPIPLYWKGEQVRDFIYVEDLAEAHIAPLKLTGFNIFNVGTEKGVKVIDVVNTLSDILGYKVKIDDLGQRPGDVAATYASSAKLHKVTGWKAKVGLKEGLKRTVEWFRESI